MEEGMIKERTKLHFSIFCKVMGIQVIRQWQKGMAVLHCVR